MKNQGDEVVHCTGSEISAKMENLASSTRSSQSRDIVFKAISSWKGGPVKCASDKF